MTRFPAAALLGGLMLAAGPALPDAPPFRGVHVPAARLAGAGEGALAVLAQAVVIGQNCDGWRTTDGEWALLTGASDAIAARLGLSPEAQDARFWRPAFRLLDEPGGCARHGWAVAKALGWLRGLGGRSGD
jgi:hypothetical protein